MKYIDAEKLKKIVEQAKQRALKGIEVDEDMYCDGRADAFGEVLLEIYSLQQEQPEVDLEKELKNERIKLLDAFGPMNGEQSLAVKNFARHFYEVGLNARKEENK